ncbi:MAG: hypothetical protein NC254_00960 [bacterium]|nr:hypothetical protein [bacterium]
MFEFLKRWFGKKRKDTAEEETFDFGDWEQLALRRQEVDMTLPEEREKYVRALMEQTADAAATLSELNGEYNRVTSYLKDVDEVEALPDSEYDQLVSYANKILSLEQARQEIPEGKSRMPEEEYRRIEEIEPEAEEALAKLRENEEYRELVKHDLRRLHAERQAYEIRRNELRHTMHDTKGMSLICICAMSICFALLLLFQFGLHMDSSVGYLLAGLVTAGVLVYVYIRYHEASKELTRVTAGINKLILLQNRVKIRYVNNTNLLDYLYMKYHTESSAMLEQQLQMFYEEQEYRKQYERTVDDLSYFRRELLRLLQHYQLFDPLVWMRRPEAFLDSRERVEFRHSYNEQRQKLRKQMEHNRDLVERAKQEIREIVKEYPESARAILAIVEEYENEQK